MVPEGDETKNPVPTKREEGVSPCRFAVSCLRANHMVEQVTKMR